MDNLHEEGGVYQIVSATPSCFGDKTNPRSSATVATADGTQELAPRNGRACESGLLALIVLSNEHEQHFTDRPLMPTLFSIV